MIFHKAFIFCLLCLCFFYCSHPTSTQYTYPTISLISPSNGAVGLDTAVNLSWQGTAANNAPLTYTIQILPGNVNYPDFIAASGISATSFLLTGLKYNTDYGWRVISFDGRDSSNIIAAWGFRTKNRPITDSSFYGLWKTDSYVGGVLTYHFSLLLNSDGTWQFTNMLASTGAIQMSPSGNYSITSSNTIRFICTSSSHPDSYYTYSFSNDGSVLFLTSVSGWDFCNGVAGVTWPFSRH